MYGFIGHTLVARKETISGQGRDASCLFNMVIRMDFVSGRRERGEVLKFTRIPKFNYIFTQAHTQF